MRTQWERSTCIEHGRWECRKKEGESHNWIDPGTHPSPAARMASNDNEQMTSFCKSQGHAVTNYGFLLHIDTTTSTKRSANPSKSPCDVSPPRKPTIEFTVSAAPSSVVTSTSFCPRTSGPRRRRYDNQTMPFHPSPPHLLSLSFWQYGSTVV